MPAGISHELRHLLCSIRDLRVTLNDIAVITYLLAAAAARCFQIADTDTGNE